MLHLYPIGLIIVDWFGTEKRIIHITISSYYCVFPLRFISLISGALVHDQLLLDLQFLLYPAPALRCVLGRPGYLGQNQCIHLFLALVVIFRSYIEA